MKVEGVSEIVDAIAKRHAELDALLTSATSNVRLGPSLLPEWTRTTIVCHLRYGAEASHAMTVDALAGRETAFYPAGRADQRPSTLRLRPNETPAAAVESLITANERLDRLWTSVGESKWQLPVREPANNRDLGTTTLGLLALLRLTEVEVHGHDLDLGAAAWSAAFVNAALPMRIRWLPSRRSNHDAVDHSVQGTWILRPTGESPWAVRSTAGTVEVEENTDLAGDAEITGSKRDLLAWLLGRLSLQDLTVAGDAQLAAAFHRAFPAP